jgi:hypothetical protein
VPTQPKTKSQVRQVCPACEHVFLPSLKEKQSRAGKAARRKGANFENKKAKEVAKWWNQGKTEFEFKRTPMSGGSALKDGFDMAGDICTNAPDFKWHLELKNQPSNFTGLHNFFSEKAKVWAWLRQAEEECPVDKNPMLIFNRFDMATFCAAFNDHASYIADRLERCRIQHFMFFFPDSCCIAIWQYKDMLESDPENWK